MFSGKEDLFITPTEGLLQSGDIGGISTRVQGVLEAMDGLLALMFCS